MIDSRVFQNKKIWYWGSVLTVVLVLFWNLNPFRKIEDLVGQAIETSGGLKSWKKKQAVQFLATQVFYDPAGVKTDKKTSMYRILLQKTAKARVESVGDPDERKIFGWNGRRGWAMVNGSLEQDSSQLELTEQFIRQTVYFHTLPFSLKKKGQTLQYAGVDKETGLEKIKIKFAQKGMGMQGEAVLFLDRQRRIAKIVYQDGSRSEWSDYQEVEGIQWACKRVFYDSAGANMFMELIEEIEFRAYFADQLFERPQSR